MVGGFDGWATLPMPTVEIDYYEDNDLGEYTKTRNGSSSTTTTDSYEGSYALEQTFSGTNYAEIQSTSGLNAYPKQGDTVTWHVKRNSNTDTAYALFYAVQSETDSPDSYQVDIRPANGSFRIVKWSSGSPTALNSVSASYPSNEWMTVKLDWGNDGSMTATIEDSTGTEIASVSASDTAYSSGGIGFRANDKGQQASMQVDGVDMV